jgi:hypothetical protein
MLCCLWHVWVELRMACSTQGSRLAGAIAARRFAYVSTSRRIGINKILSATNNMSVAAVV